jgi:2'-hydroxyisoflavone reductase
MPSDRRTFLKWSAIVGGTLGLRSVPALAHTPFDALRDASPNRDARSKSLDILILGGTGFTGPAQVEYALARGHRVTLFNRNKTRPGFFQGRVTELIGDLSNDVSALRGKKFDVVIDNPTTLPAWIRNAAQHLAGNTGHYVFISTQDVYKDNSRMWPDETDELVSLPAGVDPYTLVPQDAARYYGPLKAYSEGEVEKHYPGINTVIRPCLIVGPLDRTDRFTYWPVRIARGGEVLAPGTPADPVQIIDSRDLGEWTIRMAENREFGAYNGVGPKGPFGMAEMLYGIKAITTEGAQFTWVPAAFLREQKVSQWRNMPVWFAPEGKNVGISAKSNARAISKGLTFRPLAVTAKETLDWHNTRSEAERTALADGATSGISAAREAEVLGAWKARQGGGA